MNVMTPIRIPKAAEKKPSRRKPRTAAAPAPAEPAPAAKAEAAPPLDQIAALDDAFATATAVGDIDKAERIEALRAKVLADRAETAWTAAMSVAQAAIAPVARSAENEDKGSAYAPLEAIVEAITPVIKANGFSTVIQTRTEGPMLRVTADVGHSTGHTRRFEYDVPLDSGQDAEGNARMNAPQAYGTTVTYARRYVTCMIFNVVSKGDRKQADRDGETKPGPATITEPQVAAIEKALRGKDMHPKLFLAKFKVRSICDLPASKFEAALVEIANVEMRAP